MKDFDMKITAERIRDLREGAGMFQKDLAQKIGVAQNTISQYENASYKLSVDVLFKLAIALNISSDYLLGLED